MWKRVITAVVLCLSLNGCDEDSVVIPSSDPLFIADIVSPEADGESATSLNAGQCTPIGNLLGAPCDELEVCRQGLVCTDGKCAATGDREEGATCCISIECAPGLVCGSQGLCTVAGSAKFGEMCLLTESCEPGLFCEHIDLIGLCQAAGSSDVSASCTSTAQCAAGLVCDTQGGTCTHPVAIFAGFVEPRDCKPDDGPGRVLFEIPRSGDVPDEFYRLPFPTDVRLQTGHIDLDGHPRMDQSMIGFDPVGRLLDAMEVRTSGYSTSSRAYFRFSRMIQVASIVKSQDESASDAIDTLALIDITPGSPDYGERIDVSWQASMGATSAGRYICENWLAVQPAWERPLRPATTYAAVLMNGVVDIEGTPIEADADFLTMMGDSTPSDGDLAAAWQVHSPLRNFAHDNSVELPVPASRLLGAAVFTTGQAGEEVRRLRDAVAESLAPSPRNWTLCDDGIVSPCDDGLTGKDHTRGCFGAEDGLHEIHGELDLPIFQEGTAPYATPSDGGGIAVDAAGKPVMQRKETVCFSLAIPDALSMPEAGWPVVIYAHGTDGNFRSVFTDGVASGMAQIVEAEAVVGVAILSIEQVAHGPRAAGSDLGPDALFLSLANPDAALGNRLQAASDLFQLQRMTQSVDLAEAASPTGTAIRLDPTRVMWVGHSQGGAATLLASSQSQASSTLVLSGVGGGLSLAMLERTSPFPIGATLGVAFGDLKSSGESRVDGHHPALALVQHWLHPADPLAVATHIHHAPPTGVAPKSALLLWGIGDTYGPEVSVKVLASAMGTWLATPTRDHIAGVHVDDPPIKHNYPDSTNVVSDHAPQGYDGSFVLAKDTDAFRQARHFIGTALTASDGIPTLVP